MSEREPFRAEGVGCWCPETMTLRVARVMGHTKTCTEARIAWRANMRHLSEIDRQKRVDAEVGRQVLAAAASSLVDDVPEVWGRAVSSDEGKT